MTDQTPPNSLPPLGTTSPGASTPPPPPPPPRPAMPAAATPAAQVSPPDEGPARQRPRRSIVFAAFAVLAVGGVAAGLLVGTGGGDSSADDSAAPAAAPDTAAPATVAAPVATLAPEITAAPTTTEAPTTTAAPTTTSTTIAPTTTQAGPSYPTLPDGSPEPIVAIFDGPTIRVTGWVPSEEKAAQLEGLALANSTDPTAQVDADWQIDPSVPLSIGTRVIEMNSPRFPAGSSEITFEHGEQLSRVASVLALLPNVTVTVVGHADQIGDEVANYALSEARAVSVVRYLVGSGIEPSRLAARAVGEEDLLFEDDSAESLELNRRTEFIFYGLLAD